MKRIFILAVILGIAWGSSFASAEEKETKVKGQAVIGSQGIRVDQKSSKFFEYRDIRRGFAFNLFSLNFEKGNRYLNFSANRIRQKDEKYNLSLGSHGKLNLDFEWNKTPHLFSLDGRTLYVESEPGVFTLSDQIQRDAQNAVGDGGVNGTALIGNARTLVSSFLAGAHPVSLDLVRNKRRLRLAYAPSVPLSLNLYLSREERNGSRPFGASLGFNHVIEVAEPVDYKTTDLDAHLEYSKQRGTLRVGYYTSIFENEIQTLVWDNPYRITDQTYETPSGAYINGNGSVLGQLALAPSNTAQKIYIKGSLKPAKSTRLSGSISYGLFSQDEPLLPYTVNTVLVNDYSGALAPPADSANAKANVTSMDFSFNSKVVKSVYLNAGYRYYNFHNKIEELALPGYSRFDQVWEDISVAVEPYKFIRSSYFGDFTFNLIESTSLRVGYSFSSIERELGEENEGKSDEKMFRASVDNNLLDWLTVRISYYNAKREWSLEGKKDLYISGFNFRRYHEANRDRSGINLLVGLSPLKNLDLSASYMRGKDEYPKSEYGLKESGLTMYSIDLSYALSTRSALYGFYSDEKYKGDQAARQSAAVFPTSALNDWTAELKDTIRTFGGGLSIYLKKDVLNADLSYTYSKAEGTSALDSPPGGTPNGAADFTKMIDATKLQAIKAKLIWKLSSSYSVAFGYWYEQFELEDITRNDWKVDLLAAGQAIYLGALDPGYKYHVVFARFIYAW